jgi:hypothetical protein
MPASVPLRRWPPLRSPSVSLRLSEVDLGRIDRIMAGSVAVAGPFPETGRLSTETSIFTDTNVS